MPLLSPSQLNPGLSKALEVAGMRQPSKKRDLKDSADFDQLLEEKGLDAAAVLEQVGNLMKYAEAEPTRLAAAKLGLQLNRILEDDDLKKVPVVNILIQDSEYTQINPILLPR